jgi:hypothetical protein
MVQLSRLKLPLDDLGMSQAHRDRASDIGSHDRCWGGSSLVHCLSRPPQLAVPIFAQIEVRPSTALAASLADKPRLNIGEPDFIRPMVCRHRNRVAAAVVRAVNQDAGRAAAKAHLSEDDLLLAQGEGSLARSQIQRRSHKVSGGDHQFGGATWQADALARSAPLAINVKHTSNSPKHIARTHDS